MLSPTSLFKNFAKILPSPHTLALIWLGMVILAGGFVKPISIYIPHILLILGITLVGHALWKKGIKYDAFLKDSLISAGILIALFEPASNLSDAIPLAIAASIAISSRIFLRYRGVPVVNPAGLSVLIVGLLSFFGLLPLSIASWWGANAQIPFFHGSISLLSVLSILGAVCIITKLKKWFFTLSFFAVILIGLFAFKGIETLLFLIQDGTLYLFFGLMACEPKTSPITTKHQVILGASLALLAFVATFVFSFPEPYLFSLIITNLLMHAFKRWKLLS